MDGILAVDKPRGWTSHDVVAKVRRLIHQRSIGHAGTLDPMATGVLLLCIGEATKLSDALMEGDKWYLARVRFGVETDTDDAMGRPTAEHEATFDMQALQLALRGLLGAIQQVPPAFAAIKQHGAPVYKRARKGESVILEPRAVTVFSVALLRITPGFATGGDGPREPIQADVLICCSKGTYIRSLARDLGRVLGCGAHLNGLRRLASGSFTVHDCRTLAILEDAAHGGPEGIVPFLRPIDWAVRSWPAVVTTEAVAKRVRSGVPFTFAGAQAAERLRVYDQHGALIALAQSALEGERVIVQPRRVFAGGACI